MQKLNGPLGWFLAGAGTGLLIGFSTRWYWGAVAFLLLSLVIAAAGLGVPKIGRGSERRRAH